MENRPWLDHRPWWQRSSRILLIGFLAIAGFFLWTEHSAHLLGILPYALLLLCPAMMFFCMNHDHGHESGEGGGSHNPRSNEDSRRGA